VRNKYTSDGSDDVCRFVCKEGIIVSGSRFVASLKLFV